MMRLKRNRAAALIVALCLLLTAGAVWAGRDLRTNTDTVVTVGPFYDVAGLIIETGLTITNERIAATADHNNGTAVILVLDNVTGATSATANDLNYVTGNDAGLMQIELAAANVNYLGRFFLSITDATNHVPVFHEFNIISAAEWDRKYGTGATVADIYAAVVTNAAGTDIAADIIALKAETVSILEDTGTTLPASLATIPHSDGTLSFNATANESISTKVNADASATHGPGPWIK